MADKGSDNGGWPDSFFRLMEHGHDKFMRKTHDERPRCPRDRQKDISNTSEPPSTRSSNPFVAFKTFVDDNLTSVVDNFRSFPSNVAELKAKMRLEREQQEEDELDIARRWTGRQDPLDHTNVTTQPPRPEARMDAAYSALMLLSEASRRHQWTPSHEVASLYRDDSRFGDLGVFACPILSEHSTCSHRSETKDNLPSPARSSEWPAPKYTWLSIDWFKRSCYSPIRLEAHQNDGVAGHPWRAAFEDLINATLDRPMTSVEQRGHWPPYGNAQNPRLAPGLDWMLSLSCRGVLPPQLPSLYSRDPHGRDTHGVQVSHIFQGHGRGPSAWDRRLIEFDQLTSEIAESAPVAPPSSPASPLPTTEQTFAHWEGAEMSDPRSIAYCPFPSKHLYLDPAWLLSLRLVEAHRRQRELQGEVDVSRLEIGEEGFIEKIPFSMERQNKLMLLAVRKRQDSTRPPDPPSQHMSEYSEGEAEQTEIWLPALTGNKEADQIEAQEALYDALSAGDAGTASECLDAWQAKHGSVDEFVSEAIRNIGTDDGPSLWDDWSYTLLEAMESGDAWRKLWAQRAVEERTTTSSSQEGDELDSVKAQFDQNERKDESEQAKGVKKVDVLSSLTTTQTTLLPDGTITTKMVLRQRFADGREEVEEKIHTYRESVAPEEGGRQLGQDGKVEKKNGWFWT